MKRFCIQGINLKKTPGFLFFLLLFGFLTGAPPAQEQSVVLAPSSQQNNTPIPDSDEILTVTDLAEKTGKSLEKKKPDSQPLFRITSEEFLDYDEESNFIYGRTRTKVWYKDVYLEADRLIYDVRLNEVQAYGDIILKTREDEYRADSLWYSMDKGRGYAFGAKGRRKQIFIHSDSKEKEIPTFELLGQTDDHKPREALFRKSFYTTCDFPVPHYRISCKEILLYPDDRIFIRGATFYIWDVPVFYLPVYTRSLRESFPWSFYVGYASDLGAYLRIAYDYHHSVSIPDIKDEEDWKQKSRGHLSAYHDYFTKRGFGSGAKYKYFFDYGRHKGTLEIYGISDDEFEVKDYSAPDEIDEMHPFYRWIANFKHRSLISDKLTLQLSIDQMSDPDLYYEILDRFNEIKQQRKPECNMEAALSYHRNNYIARLLFNIRERIGRDRINNYADPNDNDNDLDIDPFRREELDDYEGFLRKRYGHVSKRLPQFTFSTSYLKLSPLPIYTYSDLNIINNLDKGLNILDTGDDAWVRGADLYQAFLYRWRLAPNYTLTSRLGLGASYLERQEYDFNYHFPPGTVFPYDLPNEDGGLTFLDEDTFIVGRRYYDSSGNLITTTQDLNDWRTRSLDDVEKYYLYSDFMLYFYSRLTNYLNAWIRYDIRKGTDNSLGEFYESLGDILFRHDLYNFRLPQHWARSGMQYFLLYPNITTDLSAGYNLQDEKDIYSNEELYFSSLAVKYINNPETFHINSSVRYSGRQQYDPSDPSESSTNYLYGNLNARYIPLSKLWWTSLNLSGHRNISGDDNSSWKYGFNEYDPEFDITGTLGAQIGPKYVVEGRATFKERLSNNGISYIGGIIKRDLHDFIVSVMIGLRRDIRKEEYDDDDVEGDMKWDFHFTVELKSPYQQSSMGAPSILTLLDLTKQADVAGGDNSSSLFVNP